MKQEYIQVGDINSFFVSVGTGHPLLWVNSASPVASVTGQLKAQPGAASGDRVLPFMPMTKSGFWHTENAIGSFDAKTLINA
jgi:hypothetical protein